MNMIDVQEKLKDFSEQQLIQEMQSPSGTAPQFLVLSEITRRKRMRDSMQPQDSGSTVAEEVVASAGVPQGGLATMAQALAPQSSIAQNTAAPVQGMYGGGYVQKMAAGGVVVRNGRRYIEQEDGTFVDEMTGVRVMTPGQDISAMMSGIVGLPSAAGGAFRDLSAGMANRMNEDLAASGRAAMLGQMGQAASDMRAGPMTGRSIMPPTTMYDDALPVDLDLTQGAADIASYLKDVATQDRMTGLEPAASLATHMSSAAVRPEFVGSLPEARPSMARPEVIGSLPAGENAYDRMMREAWESTSPGVGLGGTYQMPQAARAEQQDGVQPSGESMIPGILEYLGDSVTAITNPAQALGEKAYEYFVLGENPYGYLSAEEDGDAAATEEEAPAGAEDNTAAQKTDVAPLVDAGGGAGTTTGGSGSGVARAVGAAPMSSYEQELMDAMKRAEKRAEQDKWLSLAQVGLQLMSSTQPTLGGALGEAGAAGLEAFRSARNTAEEERLGLSKALYDIQSARAAAAASQRAAGARASGSIDPAKRASEILSQIGDISKIDDFGGVVIRPGMEGAYASLVDEYNRIASGGSGTFDATIQ